MTDTEKPTKAPRIRVELRCSTPEEKAEFEANAALRGLSVSDYLKELNQEETERRTKGVVPASVVRKKKAANDNKILFHLTKIGTNINQIAHALNIREDRISIPAIKNALSDVQDVMRWVVNGRA